MKGSIKPGRTTSGFRFGGTVGSNKDPGFTRRSAAEIARNSTYSLADDPIMSPQLHKNGMPTIKIKGPPK